MVDTTDHPRFADSPLNPADPDDRWTPPGRVTVFWWANFDRPIVLTALGAAGLMLAIWATPAPVWVVGLCIALISLTAAARLWVREFRTPAAERGCAVIEETAGRSSC
jgi:hypothetical protein